MSCYLERNLDITWMESKARFIQIGSMRRNNKMNKIRFMALFVLNAFIGTSVMAAPVFFGPSSYLSEADIPGGFYQTGVPAFLDNFEDGPGIGGGLTASHGSRIGPGAFTGARDSVDGDDGAIDGSGVTGSSWFSGSGATGVQFTYTGSDLPTAFGLVWTDGAGSITFKAFDGSDTLLFSQTFNGIPDGSVSGTTAEDRFFGLTFDGGIKSIFISNSGGGIEVDHVQYGTMFAAPIPEPDTWALLLAGLALIGMAARRRR